MDVYILDGLNGKSEIISDYESVIWNVQYFDLNDFQMIVPATDANINNLKPGTLLVRDVDITSNAYYNVMVIKNYQLDFDIEKGWFLTISGKGLKSLLEQRIVWTRTNLTGLAEAGIRQIINDNVIAPVDTERQINNFVLDPSNGFTETIDLQLFGENIAGWLVEICKTYGYGWDIYIKDGEYHFKLYKGVDRTYNQNEVIPVVFSPEYDNLIASTYEYNVEAYQNAALIGGEGEGAEQRTATVGSAEGLQRFEAFIDGGSVSSNGEPITVETYLKMLQEFGQTQLNQTAFTQKFSGDIVPEGLFIINEDYFLGDIVQIENEKGIKATPRIIEIIYAEEEGGSSVIPTFSEWEVNSI